MNRLVLFLVFVLSCPVFAQAQPVTNNNPGKEGVWVKLEYAQNRFHYVYLDSLRISELYKNGVTGFAFSNPGEIIMRSGPREDIKRGYFDPYNFVYPTIHGAHNGQAQIPNFSPNKILSWDLYPVYKRTARNINRAISPVLGFALGYLFYPNNDPVPADAGDKMVGGMVGSIAFYLGGGSVATNYDKKRPIKGLGIMRLSYGISF